MEPSSGIKTWQWVVTVIVILALIVVGVMVFGGNKTEETSGTEETPSTSNALSANRIVMSDQYPGNVVYLSSVQVANPSWVVIQEDNKGVPGAIIGSAHFDKGINPGKITLTKPIIDGSTYYAVLYTDSSGNKTFDSKVETPIKDANGSVIMKIFKASSLADSGLKG